MATIHRPANVDDPAQAAPDRRRCCAAVAELVPLVVPLHPRGRPTLEAAGLGADDRLRVVDPLGYVDFLSLVRGAALVVTDSGGIQEETTVLGVPVPDRPAQHRAADHDQPRHQPAGRAGGGPRRRREALADGGPLAGDAPPLWDGAAGERIAAIVERWLAAATPVA